jgi:formylglycine-generating enzyme required for sulfatase activity
MNRCWVLLICLLSSCVIDPPRSDDAAHMLHDLMTQMVLVPGGQFQMGDARSEARKTDVPVHAVAIKPFKISKYEITFAQYDAFARATGRALPDDPGKGRGRHPVTHVTWDDANAFAQWVSKQTGLTFRLPSESEWEYAARAGTNTNYAWGNDFNSNMANSNARGDGWKAIAPVGSYASNAFGLYDMAGNVWEWTADCAVYNYVNAPADGSANESGDCELHAVRGGSWYSDPEFLRVYARNWDENSVQLIDLGFRLAQELN